MPTFNNGESGASVRSKINAAIQEVDNVSGDIVGTTGTQTLTNKTLTSPDINGGSVDGVTLGTNSAVTEAQVDNINIDGNTISSTDTNGDINLEPDGTGGVVTTKTITAAQYDSTESLPDIKPSLNLDFANVKKLDPRITYTRASTGTYYDGKTFAKAEENLLPQSQDFTTTWSALRTTVTANTDTAPDGTTSADSFLQASGQTLSALLFQDISVVAGDYVVSVYAKPNGKNFLIVRESVLDGTANDTWFDVSTGAVGTSDAGHTATITASTNSYYRCSIKLTVNAARTGRLSLYVADSDGSLTVADDGNGLYLWGAQLEQRSALTDYTPTTTQPITNYIPAMQTAASGVARFDHDPITSESLGFLIEEQRTNLLERSEEFDNAYWTKSDTSITSNAIVAPDGTLTGDKFIADATAANHILSRAVTVVASTAYTWSCYVKAAEYSYLGLEFYGSGGLINTFDLINGTVSVGTPYDSGTNPSGSITPVGNGWYRVTLGLTTKAGDTSAFVQLRLFEDNTYTGSFTGDGYSGVYIWGAQLEAGAFPTSYVKTTSAQATRNADAASMTGTNFSSWYNAGEGVLFVDAALTVSGFNTIASIDDGTGTDNFIQLDVNILSPRTVIWSNGVSQAVVIIGSGITQGAFNKYAVAYKFNDIAGTISGGSVVTDSSAIIPNVSQLTIGQRSDVTTTKEKLHLRKLAYYPQRLSNSTIQALTEE